MDDRPVRIAIVPGETDRVAAVGLELRDKAALDLAVSELDAAGIAVKEGSAADAEERLVERFVSVADPCGNPLELFYSQQVDGLPVSLPHGGEFVTGALGAGHVVLPAEDIDAAFDFYTRLIGLSHRDSMVVRIPGMPVRKLRFLGCNPRHHTIALTEAPSPQGMRHMMIEVDSIKTFGRSFARAREAGVLKTECTIRVFDAFGSRPRSASTPTTRCCRSTSSARAASSSSSACTGGTSTSRPGSRGS